MARARNENLNPNPLKRKKQVHVDVDNETYIAIRTVAFRASLTLPEMIEEFFRLIVDEDPLGTRIVEKCYRNKLKRSIDALKVEGPPLIDNTDADALYELIQQASQDTPDPERRDD